MPVSQFRSFTCVYLVHSLRAFAYLCLRVSFAHLPVFTSRIAYVCLPIYACESVSLIYLCLLST